MATCRPGNPKRQAFAKNLKQSSRPPPPGSPGASAIGAMFPLEPTAEIRFHKQDPGIPALSRQGMARPASKTLVGKACSPRPSKLLMHLRKRAGMMRSVSFIAHDPAAVPEPSGSTGGRAACERGVSWARAVEKGSGHLIGQVRQQTDSGNAGSVGWLGVAAPAAARAHR